MTRLNCIRACTWAHSQTSRVYWWRLSSPATAVRDLCHGCSTTTTAITVISVFAACHLTWTPTVTGRAAPLYTSATCDVPCYRFSVKPVARLGAESYSNYLNQSAGPRVS
jgi:hypothetical protein